MIKSLVSVLSLSFFMFFLTAFLLPESPQAVMARKSEPTLSVNFPVSGTATMVWNAFDNSAEPYTVTVKDRNTGSLVANFTTSNLSATVTGVPAGHVCQYAVQKNANIIIIDIIDQ